MFHKWALYTASATPEGVSLDEDENFPYSERCAPSILITFINMVLFTKEKPEDVQVGLRMRSV